MQALSAGQLSRCRNGASGFGFVTPGVVCGAPRRHPSGACSPKGKAPTALGTWKGFFFQRSWLAINRPSSGLLRPKLCGLLPSTVRSETRGSGDAGPSTPPERGALAGGARARRGWGAPAPPSPAADPGAPRCASELGASLPSRAVLSPPSPLPSHPKAGGGQAGRRAARPSQGRIRGGRSPRPWGPPPRPAAQARAAGGIPGRGCSGFIWFSFQPREAAGRGGARGRQFHSAVKRQTKPVFLQLAGGGGGEEERAGGCYVCVLGEGIRPNFLETIGVCR